MLKNITIAFLSLALFFTFSTEVTSAGNPFDPLADLLIEIRDAIFGLDFSHPSELDVNVVSPDPINVMLPIFLEGQVKKSIWL